MSLPTVFGLFYFLILAAINLTGGYGIFVDEYYYLACSKRLALGYVDQPPFSIFLLRFLGIDGSSIFFLRLVPSLLAGLSVFLVGNLTSHFIENKWSIVLASIATMTVPVLQVIFGFYSMNSIEVFFVLLIVQLSLFLKEKPIHWLCVGVVIGLGVMNKHTYIVYVFAIMAPYVWFQWKSIYRNLFFYIGVILAILLVLPNLYWQYQNGFPSLEFYKNAYLMKNIDLSLFQIIFDQILSMNPATLPLWTLGVYFYLRNQEYRYLGIAYLFLLFLFLYSKSSRPDRIASFYPVLFAGGSAFLLSDIWKKIILGFTLFVGLILAPIGMPILPLPLLSTYVNVLGVVPKIEAGNRTLLPQWFADRLDWEKFYQQVQISINGIDPSILKETAVVANFYGQAGSLEYYHIQIPVVSGHNNYFLWLGDLKENPKHLVVTGEETVKILGSYFEEKELIGKYSRRYTMETDIPIYLLKKSKVNLKETLLLFKFYR
ncbi:glycosyltransferase family 39 protein [Leptospira sp. 201903074]|uniref:ArnT family glycosyltransferase n=1 Tax=Leptospira abararensis TaxID=2810036 RepID=UPI001964D3B8|nr:glycosyltransferase family 39 protein [Leptospira abararensis]MBM9545839.1 glycosyltransferase family 39 protein [Leptospira abararensis]